MLESAYKRRGQWQLGSLTHAINAEASGYVPLPEFPKEAPDRSVRDTEDVWGKAVTRSSKKKDKSGGSEGFYGSEEDSSSESDFYSSISGSDDSGTDDSESDSELGKYVGRSVFA